MNLNFSNSIITFHAALGILYLYVFSVNTPRDISDQQKQVLYNIQGWGSVLKVSSIIGFLCFVIRSLSFFLLGIALCVFWFTASD